MNFVEEFKDWRNGEKLMCTESWVLSQREGSRERERERAESEREE